MKRWTTKTKLKHVNQQLAVNNDKQFHTTKLKRKIIMNMNEQKHLLAQNFLLNVDSRVGLQTIPDNHVSLVLTDPPYGIADKEKVTKVKGKIVTTQEAWGNDFQDSWNTIEEYYEWFKPFVAEFVRVLKEDGSMILFLDRKYTGLITYLLEKDFDLNFKGNLYFRKSNPLPHFRKNGYRSSIEEAIWFAKGKQYTFNFGEQKDMTQCFDGSIGHGKYKNEDGFSHPTEKYKWMLEPLIRNHTNPGDVVLDAFAGSGSTLLYAREQDRKAIGFEKNPDFFNLAKARLQAAQLNFDFI